MPTNLLGKNPELPYELQTEEAQLAVAQAIAAALIKQGLTPVESESVGGLLLPSAGRQVQAQTQLSQGKKMMEDVGTRQGLIAALYNKMVGEGMGRYSDLLTGGQPVPPPVDQVGPPSQFTQPDQMAAARYAGTSGLPPLMKLAEDRFKGYPTGKEIMEYSKNYDQPGQADFLRTLHPGYLTPAPEVKEHDNVWTRYQRGYPTAKGAIQEWGDVQLDPTTQLPLAIGRFGNVPKPLSPNYPTSREGMHGALSGELLKKSYEATQQANEAIASITQIEANLNQLPPEALGAGSNLKLFLNRWVDTLGGKKLDWTQNVENIKGQLDSIMASRIRLFAPVADKDVEIARNMMGANFTLDGMRQMLAFLRQRSEVVRENHRMMAEDWVADIKNLTPEERARKLRQITPYTKTEAVSTGRYQGTGRVPQAAQLKVLQDELASTTDPAEREKIQTEIQRYTGGRPGANPTPPAMPTAPTGNKMPAVGEIRDGYRYRGGDPGRKENWEKV